MRRFDDTRIDRDYDAVWEVQAEIVAEGWVAEFQIPFSQMRFSVPTEGEAVWGFCLLWFWITMLPVSNLIPINSWISERFLYLPSVGYVFAVAYGLVQLAEARPRWSPAILGLLLFLSGLTGRLYPVLVRKAARLRHDSIYQVFQVVNAFLV